MENTKNMNRSRVAKWSLVCALLLTSMLASAQTEAQDTATFQYHVGDTIIIKKDCLRYLTGERMSSWVYYVSHPIQQVGTKRWPNGILLGGILSWVDPSGLILKGAVERTDSVSRAEVERQQAEAAQEVAERGQEVEQLNELQKAQIEQQAEAHGAELIKADTTALPLQPTVPTEPSVPAVAEPPYVQGVVGGPAFVVTTQPTERNYHRFSLGLRGGAASLIHHTEQGKWECGFQAILDLQYAYYWTEFGRQYDLGIITGLSIGYTQSGHNMQIDDQYSVNTESGTIDYTISSDRIREKDGQIQAEIPILFSLTMANGFYLNVGPKLILPVYTPYRQTIANPNIDAYFPDEGVHVTNEVITGMITDEQLSSKGRTTNQWKVNISLGAELGYSWKLRNRNAFGLGVYANYGLWNAFKNDVGTQSLISITPPSNNNVATVNILPATDTYVSKLGYFDAGIKLTYHFNYPEKLQK